MKSQEVTDSGYSISRPGMGSLKSLEVSIIGNFQHWTRHGPDQPDIPSESALLWAGSWTRWPPEVLFNKNEFVMYQEQVAARAEAKEERQNEPCSTMSSHNRLQCSTNSSWPSHSSSTDATRFAKFWAAPMNSEKNQHLHPIWGMTL